MHVEHSGASSGNGHFAEYETTFASFRPTHGVRHRVTPRGESIRSEPARTKSGGFPPNGIALRIDESIAAPSCCYRTPTGKTRLPLRVSQFHKGGQWAWPKSGAAWHALLANGRRYVIYVWIGQTASPQQHALLDRVLASISVRPARGQS